MTRMIPTREQVLDALRGRRNWGRWGRDDQRGAINLINPEKVVAAAATVSIGKTVSLSRPYPKIPHPTNPEPAQHFLRTIDVDGECAAIDYYGISYHGFQATHIDALCHMWDRDGMWGGRDSGEEMKSDGSRWAGIEQWRDGITTRGVLLDVRRFRGSYVTANEPVHGWDLEDIAESQGVAIQPGDALFVYSGRDAYEEANPSWNPYTDQRPGLHASCLRVLRDWDIAVLGWDFMDAFPNEYQIRRTIHNILYAYGVALIDNCHLGTLAEVCATYQRSVFLLSLGPIPVSGGTGSPINPIAVL